MAALVHISPLVSGAEYFFIDLLPIGMSSLEKCLLKFYHSFLIFLLLNSLSSLYILWLLTIIICVEFILPK